MNCALLTNDEDLISSFKGLEEAGSLCICGIEKAQVVFVDMDYQLRNSDYNTPIVYISNNQESAIEAYEHQALDFLLKPITAYRLLKTINKVRDYTDRLEQSVGSLLVKNGSQHINLLHEEIYFIEALSDYSVIHSKRGKVIINSSLKKLEAKLNGYNFMRVQRSYIANLSLIDCIQNNDIIIQDHIVPIGASFKKKIIERIIGMHGVIG